MSMRLQKFLAHAGFCSRRKAGEHIMAGRVRVNGVVVTEPWHPVGAGDQVTVDGRPVRLEDKVYILLNKPAGYVTTVRDPQGRPTVMDLLAGIPERVYPVGRLDHDSEGALILTNDGDFADRILHPRNEIPRTYRVWVRGAPAREDVRRLREGIEIDGRMTWPARVRTVGRWQSGRVLEVIIHEGRKRQVRRMFAAIGHPVERLMRIAYGGLRLGRLAPGRFRRLAPHDLDTIFSRPLSGPGRSSR